MHKNKYEWQNYKQKIIEINVSLIIIKYEDLN
jgi:hypothetical protein